MSDTPAQTLPGASATPRVNVKGLRERLGFNQDDFAERLHVDKRTVRRWENGYSKPSPMALAQMRALARPRTEHAHAQAHSETPSQERRELQDGTGLTAPPTLPRRRIPTL